MSSRGRHLVFAAIASGLSVAVLFAALEVGLRGHDRIRARRAERGVRAEVLNLGVNGYSLGQTVRTAELGAARFHPDLLIVQISLNDPYPSEELVPGSTRRLPSRLAEFGWRRIQPRSFWAWWFVGRHYDEVGRDHLRRAWDRLAILRDTGVSVLAVLFPYLDAWGYESGGFQRFHELHAELARERGIELLDLRDAFVAAGHIVDRWPQDPQHPGPDGHRMAAETLAERMLQDGLVRTDIADSGRSP